MAQPATRITSRCQNCTLRARAQKKPTSLFARVWRWHTGWCPGWKGYVKELQSKGLPAPQA